MAYVAIDTRGARALGQALRDTATRIDTIRREVSVALNMADLKSQVPIQMSVVQDGFTSLGTGVLAKADLAERFAESPQRMAAQLGAPVDTLAAAITGLLGIAGPSDLRGILLGLPAPGRDPKLDAAVARLDPVLFPAFRSGERPQLTDAQADDLRVLARALGIEQAGPPQALQGGASTTTEVFWHDFWADGRTPAAVLADPQQLYDWVAGTFELDRRLAVAPRLPGLADILASIDFATTGSGTDALNQLIADAQTQFSAITSYLPALLVGQIQTPPDAAQLAQTLAFAARVGWPDPGPEAADAARFASAIGFLRANRALGSALLSTGFGGDPNSLTFFNEPGIALSLELGRRTGILTDAYVTGLSGAVDRALAAFGIDLSGPAPVELTEQVQGQFFALVASQIPAALAQSPTIQSQFLSALGYLRQAATGPQLRQRLIETIAAFRTVAVTGAPALTERQLVDVVGTQILGVLGRSRLRQRGEQAVQRNPEFLMVALQWGRPGGQKQDIGKFKFSWSFDEFGVLTGIQRKKKSWLSRAFDTIKSIGKALVESWKDNPFKAIFQIGKIALGALAIVVPGLGLGVASLALSLAETAFHAVEGDWMAALGAGLSAFTAGATDVFGTIPTAVQEFQQQVVDGLLGTDALAVLKNVKRAFDIGTTAFAVTQANSLAGLIGAGLGAAGTVLGSGGQLLGGFAAVDTSLTRDLVRLGTTVRDLTGIVAPAASLIAGDSDGLLALANGLGVLATGAKAFSNPLGAGALLGFDGAARETLKTIAAGTGVAAAVARAIDAADHGEAFRTGSFLALAVQALHDPRTTIVGDRAQIVQRIADIGTTLEKVVATNANPAAARAAAPILLAQLRLLVDDASTLPKPVDPGGAAKPVAVPAFGTPPRFVLGDGGLVNASGLAGSGNADPLALPGSTDLFGLGASVPRTFDARTPRADDMIGPGAGDDVVIGGAGQDLLSRAGVPDPMLIPVADLFDPGTREPSAVPLPQRSPILRPAPAAMPEMPIPPFFPLSTLTADLADRDGDGRLDWSTDSTLERMRLAVESLQLAPGSLAHSLDGSLSLAPHAASGPRTGKPAEESPDPGRGGRGKGPSVSAKLTAPVAEVAFVRLDETDGSAAATARLRAGLGAQASVGRVGGSGSAQLVGTAIWELSPASAAVFQETGKLPDWSNPDTLHVGDRLTSQPFDQFALLEGEANGWEGEGTFRINNAAGVKGGRQFNGGPATAVERTADGFRVYSGEVTFQRTPGGVTLTEWYGAVYAAERSTFNGVAMDIGDRSDPQNLQLLADATRAALSGTDLPIPPGVRYTRFTETGDSGNWEVSGLSPRVRDLTGTQRDSLAMVQHMTRESVRTDSLYARGENGEEIGLGATESRNTFLRDGVSPTAVKVFTDLGEFAPFGNTEAVKVVVDSYVDGGGAGSKVTVKTPGTVYHFNEDDLYGRARQIAGSGDEAADNPLIQELNKGFSVTYALKNATDSWMPHALPSWTPFKGATNDDITAAFDALARYGPAADIRSGQWNPEVEILSPVLSDFAAYGLDAGAAAELPSDYFTPTDFSSPGLGAFGDISMYDGATVVTTEGW